LLTLRGEKDIVFCLLCHLVFAAQYSNLSLSLSPSPPPPPTASISLQDAHIALSHTTQYADTKSHAKNNIEKWEQGDARSIFVLFYF
jgi:hypothetical protein